MLDEIRQVLLSVWSRIVKHCTAGAFSLIGLLFIYGLFFCISQAIEERERRQRLRYHRQMRFRDADQPISANPFGTHPVDSLQSKTLGANSPSSAATLVPHSEPGLNPFSSSDSTHSGLRRSKRVKTFRMLLPEKKQRNIHKNESEHPVASLASTTETFKQNVLIPTTVLLSSSTTSHCSTSVSARLSSPLSFEMPSSSNNLVITSVPTVVVPDILL